MHKRSLIVAAGVLLAFTFTLGPHQPAEAQTPEQIEKTEKDMNRYFQREKGGGIGLMAIGGGSAIAGGLLLFQESEAVQGVGFPLLGLGIVSLAVGVVVYLRTDEQVAELTAQLGEDPSGFKKEEKERMDELMLGLDVVKTLEVLFVVGGISAAVIGKANKNDVMRGIGWGLAGEGGALLVMDVIASRRATVYIKALDALEVEEEDQDGGEEKAMLSGAILGVQGTF